MYRRYTVQCTVQYTSVCTDATRPALHTCPPACLPACVAYIHAATDLIRLGSCLRCAALCSGELAVLFKPGSTHGQVRRRSAYASKDDVTLGVLTYENLINLRRERSQISDLVVPYANTIRSEMITENQRLSSVDGGASSESSEERAELPLATLLDCHPELELLQAEMQRQMDTRMEALQVSAYVP